jgi:hypothetical protein
MQVLLDRLSCTGAGTARCSLRSLCGQVQEEAGEEEGAHSGSPAKPRQPGPNSASHTRSEVKPKAQARRRRVSLPVFSAVIAVLGLIVAAAGFWFGPLRGGKPWTSMSYTAGEFSTQVAHGAVRNQDGVMGAVQDRTVRRVCNAPERPRPTTFSSIPHRSTSPSVPDPTIPCDEDPDSPCEHHPEMWSAPAELTLSDAQGTPFSAQGAEVKQGQSLRLHASFDVGEARAIRAE